MNATARKGATFTFITFLYIGSLISGLRLIAEELLGLKPVSWGYLLLIGAISLVISMAIDRLTRDRSTGFRIMILALLFFLPIVLVVLLNA